MAVATCVAQTSYYYDHNVKTYFGIKRTVRTSICSKGGSNSTISGRSQYSVALLSNFRKKEIGK